MNQKTIFAILGVVVVVLIGITAYFAMDKIEDTNKLGQIAPRIFSVNIVDLAYEEIGASANERCDVCFKNPNNPAACVGPSIKSSFNLQVENFKNPAYCKVTSSKGDLTNPFSSNNGLNNIQDAYGEQLKEKYKVKVCCSIEQDLSNSVCSEERFLDERCLVE